MQNDLTPSGFESQEYGPPEAPIVAIHVTGDGPINGCHVSFTQGVRVLVIDERARHDRVYEMTMATLTNEALAELIGGDSVGHCNDERHAAIAHKVLAYMEGRSRLSVVGEE